MPRADAEAALTAIGGEQGPDLLDRARRGRAGDLSHLRLRSCRPTSGISTPEAVAVYRPFDVIESFRISDGEETLTLQALVIFDDAHSLHPPSSWRCATGWPAANSRWRAGSSLASMGLRLRTCCSTTPLEGEEPGLKRDREITDIWMQSPDDQAGPADRLPQDGEGYGQPVSRARWRSSTAAGLKNLGDLLSTAAETIAPGKREKLAQQVDALQRRLGVTADRRRALEQEIDAYLATVTSVATTYAWQCWPILLERYSKRVPQRGLFEEPTEDAEPNRPLTADASMADGAASI